MEIWEKIRKKLGEDTGYQMAKRLGIMPQMWDSLVNARDRIKFRDLLLMRELAHEIGWSDKKLLDELQKELKNIDSEDKL